MNHLNVFSDDEWAPLPASFQREQRIRFHMGRVEREEAEERNRLATERQRRAATFAPPLSPTTTTDAPRTNPQKPRKIPLNWVPVIKWLAARPAAMGPPKIISFTSDGKLLAVVAVGGRIAYLGLWGRPTSERNYAQLLAEVEALRTEKGKEAEHAGAEQVA